MTNARTSNSTDAKNDRPRLFGGNSADPVGGGQGVKKRREGIQRRTTGVTRWRPRRREGAQRQQAATMMAETTTDAKDEYDSHVHNRPPE